MNFGDLVGSMLKSGMSKSTSRRLENIFKTDDNEPPSGRKRRGGGLGDLLGSLTGGSGGGGLGDTISGMLGGGRNKSRGGTGMGGLLEGILGQANQSMGGKKNLAIGGLAALAGAVLGGGGRSVKGALGGGVMALLGAMAFKALKGGGQAKAEVPLGLREPQTDDEVRELEHNSELVFKAMLNAAKADGNIDEQEIRRIVGKARESGMDDEARQYIMAELKRPIDLDPLISAAAGRPDLGAQLYAASLMAIEVDTSAEKAYMQKLAGGLGLSRETTGRLEEMLGMAG